MTLTINTVDGKSVQANMSGAEYQDILGRLNDDSFILVTTGAVEHLVRVRHITTIKVSK